MVDILKITSPITSKNKVENLPKHLPKDAVFDITDPNNSGKIVEKKVKQEDEKNKQFILKNLNRQIFEPILNSPKIQSDTLKKLVLMLNIFNDPKGEISKDFLDKMFIRPDQLLLQLLTRDKNETVFKGEFFDSLRLLLKVPNQPDIKDAIGLILKNFDCFVKRENSLSSIIIESQNLTGKLTKAEAEKLNEAIERLNYIIKESKGNQKEINTHIKSMFVPVLSNVAKSHRGNGKVYNNVMSIIHNIVRYDNSDPAVLEDSVMKFGEELSKLTTLTEEETTGMKKLVFQHAKQVINDLNSGGIKIMPNVEEQAQSEEKDIATLISKTLEKAESGKITSVAQNLLTYMIQSESPILPYIHFTLPVKFYDENTYGEFIIDKECKEKRGNAKEASNIFFTIQSDKYGTFEVDLMSKDKIIELEIKSPENLLGKVKDYKSEIKNIIENQGYKLLNYKVGAYQETSSILKKFPNLIEGKAGLDVKI